MLKQEVLTSHVSKEEIRSSMQIYCVLWEVPGCSLAAVAVSLKLQSSLYLSSVLTQACLLYVAVFYRNRLASSSLRSDELDDSADSSIVSWLAVRLQ